MPHDDSLFNESQALDLGIKYLDEKHYDRALAEFNKVLDFNPKNKVAVLQLGHVYLQQKKYSEAIQQFKRALEIDPKFIDPHEGLGLCYFEQGRLDEAMEKFNHVLDFAPDNEHGRFGLALCYQQNKEFAKAIEEFSRVLKINPHHLQANKDMLCVCRTQLGHAYFKEKSYPDAIAQFKKALELDPESLEPHEGLAQVYLEQDELEFCVAEIQKAKQLGLRSQSYHQILTRVYINQEKYELAVEELQKLSKIDPHSEFAAEYLMRVYNIQKDYKLAKEKAGLLISINPFNSSAYNIFGNIYFEEKDYPRALSQFEKALELYSREDSIQKEPDISKHDLMMIYFNIGSAYLFMREYESAIENFKKANQIEPGDNRINALISQAYIGIRDYNLGVDILINSNNASEEIFPVKKADLARQGCKIKILRIPNFYGSEVLSTEMNSIVIPPLALGNIVAHMRSQGIPVDQDDLHIKTHYDNYFCEDEEKKIDETVFFDVPRVIGYAKGNADSEIDEIMGKISIKTDFQGYEIILFSLDSCSMNDSHVMFALCLARYLKKRYSPIIILGGLNYFVELMRKNDCNFSDIDYVICNEGEEVVVNLLFSLLHSNNCHTEEGRIEENGRVIWSRKVPKPIKPDFDGLPLDKYRYKGLKIDYCNNKALKNVIEEFNQSGVSLLPFRFIKGCTNRCIFCASSLGGLIHAVNPKTVALWLEELQAKYKPTGYLFLNDTLNVSKKYLDGLCDEIIKRKLNIRWSDCVRVDRLDKDSIYRMKDAGCIRMVFGMETASRKLLDYIKKDIDLKQLEDMLYWADKASIWTGIEIISGLPYENEKDVKETIAFIKQNREHIDALYYNAFNIRDTSIMQTYPEKYRIENIFELSSYEDGFSTFVKYGFDEMDGLKWPEKRRQIVSAFNKIIENFGESPFPEHEYESFLFFLYSKYKDKKIIKNLFYSAGKEKMRYLIALRREKKSKWQIKESIDKTLRYG